MDNYFNAGSFCYGCMEEKQGVICPECGFDSRTPQEDGYLPYGTVLSGKYLTGRILDVNSDGVSYIGFDLVQNERVIIREYFPGELSFRDGDGLTLQIAAGRDMAYLACLAEFKRLWRDLARFKNLTCLFAVYDIFEENQTAYAVSEYRDFITLDRYLTNRRGDPMQWREIRATFMPVLSTLEMLHSAGMVHGGISPETLVLCDDKRVRLYGFSIPEVRISGSSVQPQLFSGYAAPEQYELNAAVEPCTDIYAFAAVLYRVLTGHNPPQAQQRLSNDRLIVSAAVAESTPSCVLKALGNAMQVYGANRTPNAEQFRAQISDAPSVAMAEPEPQPVRRQQPQAQYSQPQSTRSQPASRAPASRQRSGKNINLTVMALAVTLAIGAVICVATALLMHKPSMPAEEANVTTTQPATKGETAAPNLISKDYLEIIADKEISSQFSFLVEEEFNELPEGTVFDQDPSAGTKLPTGSEIKLKVSKGAEMVRLPSVASNKKQDAIKKLEELGFVCEVVEKYNKGDFTKGYVAGTDLPVEEEYPKGTQVIVFVWGDPPQNDIVQ